MAVIKASARPTRIECCGCRLIVSWNTATTERWIIFPKESYHPADLDRRSYLGWCRICQEKYQVEGGPK